MMFVRTHSFLIAACILLAACSTQPINAPIGARSAPPEPVSLPHLMIQKALPGHYRVKQGDTLYSIAWQHGLSYQQLATMNRVRRPYTIYAGQQLRVRASKAQPVKAPVAAPPLKTTRPATKPPARPVSKPANNPVPVTTKSASLNVVTQELGNKAVKQWVWPVKGKLLRSYHPDAPGKKGIDINARHGVAVKAAAGGKVVYTGSGLVGYGQMVIIKHNDSLLSAYGHNSQLLVTEGDFVKTGQVISKVGSSGTHRPQLYFEIRKDGKPVNPLRYLPRS